MIGGLNDKPPLNLKVELSLTEEERARRRREKDLEQQYQQEVMLLGCAYIHYFMVNETEIKLNFIMKWMHLNSFEGYIIQKQNQIQFQLYFVMTEILAEKDYYGFQVCSVCIAVIIGWEASKSWIMIFHLCNNSIVNKNFIFLGSIQTFIVVAWIDRHLQ